MIDAETGLPYSFAPDASSTAQSAGGISPLLLALMQQQGGPGMQQLLQYFMNGPGAVSAPPAPAVLQPSVAPPAAAVVPSSPAQPQQPSPSPPPPTTDQQLYMALMGVSDPSQLTPMQRGGINTALGNFSGPGSFDNAQYSTPQDFVTQWQQMFGSR